MKLHKVYIHEPTPCTVRLAQIPILTPPNRYPTRLHDTAARYCRNILQWCKNDFKSKNNTNGDYCFFNVHYLTMQMHAQYALAGQKTQQKCPNVSFHEVCLNQVSL